MHPQRGYRRSGESVPYNQTVSPPACAPSASGVLECNGRIPGCRAYVLLLGRTVIPAGSTGTPLTANVQRFFIGRQLVIPSEIALFLTFVSLSVGAVPQTVTAVAAAVSGSIFSEVSYNAIWDMDPASMGTQVTLVLGNPTAGDITASAAIFGDSQ